MSLELVVKCNVHQKPVYIELTQVGDKRENIRHRIDSIVCAGQKVDDRFYAIEPKCVPADYTSFFELTGDDL